MTQNLPNLSYAQMKRGLIISNKNGVPNYTTVIQILTCSRGALFSIGEKEWAKNFVGKKIVGK